MGLFCVPRNDASPEEIVQTAISNIELWRQHPNFDYLLDVFAVGCLKLAAEKIREQKELEENG